MDQNVLLLEEKSIPLKVNVAKYFSVIVIEWVNEWIDLSTTYQKVHCTLRVWKAQI